jgi:hypothetical protein
MSSAVLGWEKRSDEGQRCGTVAVESTRRGQLDFHRQYSTGGSPRPDVLSAAGHPRCSAPVRDCRPAHAAPSREPPSQSLHQEVRGAYAHPDRTGGMLDHLVPLAHPLWVHVQPSLDRLLHILVLSARDRALLARGAAA